MKELNFAAMSPDVAKAIEEIMAEQGLSQNDLKKSIEAAPSASQQCAVISAGI